MRALRQALTWAGFWTLLVTVLPAGAQQANGPPNALQGFSQNRDQPVKIDANSLEVRDKEKVATFVGNVRLVQGDTVLRCQTLVVFYDQDGGRSAPKSGAVGPGSHQQIRKIQAKGGVIVTQKDQTATGDSGEFDMRANTVTLIGNVVISQGPNTVKGDRLTVDLTTGVSKVECEKSSQCRVGAVIVPSSSRDSNRGAQNTSGPSKIVHPQGLY